MNRSRSNSPAFQSTSYMDRMRGQSRHSRRRSKSPNYNGRRKSELLSNENRQTFSHTSRDRSRSRYDSTSRSPLKRKRSPFSPLTRKIEEHSSRFGSRRRRSSASPSPPNGRKSDRFQSRNIKSRNDEELLDINRREGQNFDRKILSKTKIIVPNVEYSRDDVDVKRRKRLEKGITTLEQVLQLTQSGEKKGTGATCYNSQEFETPPNKELKKIQIEIRRTIPRDRISTSPVRRSLRDPSTVVFTRRPDEGMRPIFDRDEIKHWIPDVPEKRVVAMIHDNSVDKSGKRSLSPVRKRVKRSMSSERQDPYLRSRLESSSKESYQSSSGHFRSRSGNHMDDTRRSNIRSRLGKKISNDKDKAKEMDPVLFDEEKVLDRNELEKLRFANAFANESWDSNPENVPRGNYFEVPQFIPWIPVEKPASLNVSFGWTESESQGHESFCQHDNRDNNSNDGPQRGRGRGQRGFNRRSGIDRWPRQRNQRERNSWHPYNERNSRNFSDRENNRREDRVSRSDVGVNHGYYRPLGMTDEEVPILQLPREMMIKILSHVPYPHLLTSVSLVCKKFHQIISEDRLLLTDLEINISSYSVNFEEQSMKTIDLLSSALGLRYLTVHVNDRLCDMLQAVGTNCKQLRGLKILYSSGTYISLREKEECSSHLISIAQNCNHLKELRLLINCSFYTMDLINQMLLARQNTLKVLEIDSFKLSRDVFHHIANCEQLEELKLPKFTRLNKYCFNILNKKMANIRILELCVRKISDEHLAYNLSKCTSLEELTLHEADKLSKYGMRAISTISTLKRLHLNILSRSLIQPDDLLHPFVLNDGNLQCLEYLQLTGHLDISDFTLIRIIEKHESLKGIVLDGCNNVTVECFRYLYKKYPNICPLKINNHSFPRSEGIMENLTSYSQKVKPAVPYIPYVFNYRM